MQDSHTTGARAGLALIAFLALGLFAACDTTPESSIYDPDFQGLPDPAIATVEPSGSALAGVDTITITGQNFAAEAANNMVFFNSARARVVEASPTRLRVIAPNTPSDGLVIKTAVVGAIDFSNTVSYRLEPATLPFGAHADFQTLAGITRDEAGALYVNILENNVSRGIWKYAADGSRELYNDDNSIWAGLAMTPAGDLYGVRSQRAVFQLPPVTGRQTYASVSGSSRFVSIDQDDAGNLWAGGPAGGIFRIAPDKSSVGYPFDGTIRALEVFGNVLYVGGERGEMSGVWRYPINTDGSLGQESLVLNVSQQTGSPLATIRAIAVAADGTVFVATMAEDPIVLVEPNGTARTLYPGVIPATAVDLEWGPNGWLYMTRERVGTGDERPIFLAINTRRQPEP